MQQHPLGIKTPKRQRFKGDLRYIWDDPRPKMSLPFHPPYPRPFPRVTFEELRPVGRDV